MATRALILRPGYFPYFDKGKPVWNGYIYVGLPDTDPEIPANQKPITFLQEDGSQIPGSQPVRTSAGGVPTYNGSPVTVLVDGDYSIKVNDSYGAQIYYVPKAADLQDDDIATWDELSTLQGALRIPYSVSRVSSLGELSGIVSPTNGQVVVDGSTGYSYTYILGDKSVEVSDAPYDWVPLDSDPSGSEGAFHRNDFKAPAVIGGLPSSSNSTKMLVRIAQYPASIGTIPSRIYLVTSGIGGREYLLYELRRGAVTSTGSLGGSAEFLRVTSIFKQSVAWVGRHDYSAISDPADWTETQYTPVGATTKFVGGALQSVDKYWSFSAGSGGKWIEFNVPFNDQGEANLQFLRTSGGATDVEVSIDGGPSEVVDLTASSPAIYRHKITAAPGFHTVRITKPTLAGNCNVFGANFEDVSNAGRFDFLGGFVTWGGDEKYTSGEGANDYAILDDDSGLFGGSFHGGETLSEETYIIDGVNTPLQAAPILGTNIQIEQSTSIDWSGSGGGAIAVRSSHNFDKDGGYSLNAVFSGGVRSGTFYCAMHTTPETYNEIVFPVVRDISGESDGFKVVRRTDTIVQQDGVTKNKIYNKTLLVDDRGNAYGGPTIRKVSGAYNKFYYGPAISGEVQKFTALASVTHKMFA